ncbi:MAG: hypothetical protein AB1750_13950, partial [Chloroflexota bacterium]
YPRRWWLGALFGGATAALAFCLQWGIRLPLIALSVALAAGILAGILRGLLRAFHLARSRWNQNGAVWTAIAILLAFLLGLAITLPLDQAGEALTGRRAVLQKVYRYGQAQGWQDYVLHLEAMDSGYARVAVSQSNGESFACMVTQWQGPAPVDPALYDLMGIACEP